jgi:hypothetical protein
MPCRVLPPFIEIGIGALWQILSPRRFEGDACGLKGLAGVASVAAAPFTGGTSLAGLSLMATGGLY